MNFRALAIAVPLAAIAIALAALDPPAAAAGWRAAFLTVSAVPLGAVLMLAIAALVGADWAAFVPLARGAPWVLLLALPLILAQAIAPQPPQLDLWLSPSLFGLRSLVAIGGWTAVGVLLVRGRRRVAAPALAIYVLLVTPIGFDWILGDAGGHAMSSAGMLLAVEEVGAACAALLSLDWGAARLQRDMGGMLIAAGLGVAYLLFVDFLILWFGNLPHHVGWVVDRASLVAQLCAAMALLFGLVMPLVAISSGSAGLRRAGAAGALAGLLCANLWLSGPSIVAALVAVTASGAGAALLALLPVREAAHG